LKYAAKLCEYEEHDAWIVTRDSDFKNYRKFSEYKCRRSEDRLSVQLRKEFMIPKGCSWKKTILIVEDDGNYR
jgi:hypothetical protein